MQLQLLGDTEGGLRARNPHKGAWQAGGSESPPLLVSVTLEPARRLSGKQRKKWE